MKWLTLTEKRFQDLILNFLFNVKAEKSLW